MDDNSLPGELSEQSLTNWKTPPTLLDLKQDLQDAKPIHDAQVAKIERWLENLNVTGNAKPATSTTNSQIQPKLIRKQAEWRYASLSEPFLSSDDIFDVKPMTADDRLSARQNKILLNYQFNTQIDKVRFIDEYVRTAVNEGTVILQTGWEYITEEQEVEVPMFEFHGNPAVGELHDQLHALLEQDPQRYQKEVPPELQEAHDLTMQHGVPFEPVQVGMTKEKQTITISNRPTVEVCEYRNVIIDPTAQGDIEKAKFVIKSYETCLADLKKSGKKYHNLEKIQVESVSILAEPDHAPSDAAANNFNFADKARKKFVVHQYWGFWDIDDTGIVKPIVAEWAGGVMIRMEEAPFPDKKLPFVIEHYLPVQRNNHGEPDGALLEDNQKVVGAVTRGMIDILGKSANGQTGIRKDMLDATNRRKYDTGKDYEFNPQVDPRMGVFMHTYPEIPQSAQFMLQLQNMEAEAISGVKAYSNTGISGNALGDVATSIRGVLDAASKREMGILRRLANGIVKVGRKMISMNGEFLSPEEVVRVTDEEFVTIRRDDLAGNFDLRLSISTAEADDAKAQQLAFMLQTLGPDEDPMVRRMVLSDICRLRKMPDLAKKLEEFQPQPDPLAQEKMQLEIELLKAQIQKLQGDAVESNTTAELNQAKVGTEHAKAQNLLSETDQKNLDFIEQESGVKQEREKELHGEQARAQTQLKLMEHDMKRETHNMNMLKEYVKLQAAKKQARNKK